MAELFANPDFTRFSGSDGCTREQTAAVSEKFLRWHREGLPSAFAVIERVSGMLIGYCGFLHQEVDGLKEIEIGYRLHPDFWQRGAEARPPGWATGTGHPTMLCASSDDLVTLYEFSRQLAVSARPCA